MTYTFLSAHYANEQNTAVVAITEEVAAVALSEVDTPADWDDLLQWADGDGTIGAFVPTDNVSPDINGAALDERQRQTAKDEAAALAKAGDLEAAFTKLLELI